MWSNSNYRSDSINYWPSFLDVLTAALMVFVLSTYLQVILQEEPPKDHSASTADEQARLVRKREHDFASSLEAELRAEIATRRLEYKEELGFVHIRFNAAVLFEIGGYQLSDTGKEILTHFGVFLGSACENVNRIEVQGYTDDQLFTPDKAANNVYPSDNWQLSSARATEVANFLIKLPHHPPQELFSATGNAENGALPPERGETEEETRKRNRRVEIELHFSSDTKMAP